jgi:hypothetical protein
VQDIYDNAPTPMYGYRAVTTGVPRPPIISSSAACPPPVPSAHLSPRPKRPWWNRDVGLGQMGTCCIDIGELVEAFHYGADDFQRWFTIERIVARSTRSSPRALPPSGHPGRG